MAAANAFCRCGTCHRGCTAPCSSLPRKLKYEEVESALLSNPTGLRELIQPWKEMADSLAAAVEAVAAPAEKVPQQGAGSSSSSSLGKRAASVLEGVELAPSKRIKLQTASGAEVAMAPSPACTVPVEPSSIPTEDGEAPAPTATKQPSAVLAPAPLARACMSAPAATAHCEAAPMLDCTPEELSEGEEEGALEEVQLQRPFRIEVIMPEGGEGWRRVGDYVLTTDERLDTGGLGDVHLARHLGTGEVVALKVACHEFEEKLGKKDFNWWAFKTEWNAYVSLGLGRTHTWMPAAYEAGLCRTSRGVVPWMTMELLGPSLHALMKHIPGPQFGAYAHGMLSALEGLHRAGMVHRDIKPANFATQRGFDGSSGTTPHIHVIDLGFAEPWQLGQPAGELDFCGTPDFASIRSLRSVRPGPCDDLEAVAYSLLQLWKSEMPWDLTRPAKTKEAQLVEEQAHLILEGRTRHGETHAVATMQQHANEPSQHTSAGWSSCQLERFAARKEALWRQLVDNRQVPDFLVDWVGYCKVLSPSAMPDYAHLHRLIDQGCQVLAHTDSLIKAYAAHATPRHLPAAEE